MKKPYRTLIGILVFFIAVTAIDIRFNGLDIKAVMLIMVVVLHVGFMFWLSRWEKRRKDLRGQPGENNADETFYGLAVVSEQLREEMYEDEDEGKEEIALDSAVLGRLIYRRKPQWYEGKAVWNGTVVSVLLIGTEDRDMTGALHRLEGFFARGRELGRLLCSEAAKQRGKRFTRSLVPSVITLNENGKLELDYDAGIDFTVSGEYDGTNMTVKIEKL